MILKIPGKVVQIPSTTQRVELLATCGSTLWVRSCGRPADFFTISAHDVIGVELSDDLCLRFDKVTVDESRKS